jgi:hypothetical protein
MVGGLAGLAVGAASLLLAITVLGLVAAAALWGLLLAATVVGTAVVIRELDHDPRAQWLIAVTLFLPLIGEAIASLAAMLALGGMIRTLTRPANNQPRPSRNLAAE